ncbi:hypothetical protein D9V41_04225 [Aeromicrobium phragmitis]|uniref:AMP-dependent synthetase/ligase domain-containing protein n=1 Tax=Aeromicrobium phragmitis TaxID=2478914 RepID=A0A3L8PNK3_9ACTN|nr:AMP-binding protein [Aeromicrobium phragmitis]RLV56975.1 hypothetical protein D9V41_04225 [Aeromicrobium phragmitis]
MPSLAFRILDRHVVEGRADDPALVTDEGTLSYAQLLHESASLAGGLRDLGVVRGTPVHVDVPERRTWVLSVLAVVRLGAEPDPDARFRVAGSPATVSTPGETYDLALVLRAGRVEPACAPLTDPEGYADRMTQRYGEVISALLDGGTLT